MPLPCADSMGGGCFSGYPARQLEMQNTRCGWNHCHGVGGRAAPSSGGQMWAAGDQPHGVQGLVRSSAILVRNASYWMPCDARRSPYWQRSAGAYATTPDIVHRAFLPRQPVVVTFCWDRQAHSRPETPWSKPSADTGPDTGPVARLDARADARPDARHDTRLDTRLDTRADTQADMPADARAARRPPCPHPASPSPPTQATPTLSPAQTELGLWTSLRRPPSRPAAAATRSETLATRPADASREEQGARDQGARDEGEGDEGEVPPVVVDAVALALLVGLLCCAALLVYMAGRRCGRCLQECGDGGSGALANAVSREEVRLSAHGGAGSREHRRARLGKQRDPACVRVRSRRVRNPPTLPCYEQMAAWTRSMAVGGRTRGGARYQHVHTGAEALPSEESRASTTAPT